MNRKPSESRIDRGERFIWKDGEIEITPAPGKAMPGLASSGLPWPEFVYRLIEHYKWEPQHLRGTVAEFDTRMRRQEVPLNFLFNILLRWLSSDAIKGLLNRFVQPTTLADPWASNVCGKPNSRSQTCALNLPARESSLRSKSTP